MKKIGILFLLSGIFTACDDGDLVFESLKFDGNIQKCQDKDIYYKLSGNEMLFTYLPGKINDTVPLPLNQEFVYTTTSANEIVYRQYSDKAIANSICSVISPSFPGVVEEFQLIPGGQIKYKRIRKITKNEDSNETTLNYVYTFSFTNITLSNGKEEMKYENYTFGDLVDSQNAVFSFNFSDSFKNCNTEGLSINNGLNQAIKINIPNITFTETPRTQTFNLNNSDNIQYLYFKGGSLNSGYICDLSTLPNSIKLTEDWKATQGTLEIVTTANSTAENPNVITGYTHTLVLRNAFFKNGNDSFAITEQILGTYSN